AYTLTFAVLLVTGGRLGDIFGRCRMFLFGVAVFALSSALIGLAPSQHWLVAGRALQGVGGAFMMPGTLSIISNTFPPQERGRAIGTWAGVSALALALGPAVGGALTEYVSWRAIFFLNLPVAVGAFIVTFAMLSMFFFLALYMQNILGYTPLEAGIRFLPSTLVIIVTAPIAGRLSDRIGPRPLMTLGLALAAFALFLQSQITIHTGYG